MTNNIRYRLSRTRYGLFKHLEFDVPIGAALQKYGEWAHHELELLGKFISPGDIVLDVGAHIGTHTVVFANLVGPTGKVISFEPQPELHLLLRENIQINHFKNVECLNKAVSDRARVFGLPVIDYSQKKNFGAVTLIEYQLNSGNTANSELTQVDCITIDSLGLKQCSLIKIDVEGMELAALRGARELLWKYLPIVYTECNCIEAGWSVIRFLKEEYGYMPYLHSPPAYNENNFNRCHDNFFGLAEETNILFLSEGILHKAKQYLTRENNIVPITSLDQFATKMIAAVRAVDHPLSIEKREVDVFGAYLHIANTELHRANIALENKIRAIYASRSWRVTAPLRWMSAGLRRWRHRTIAATSSTTDTQLLYSLDRMTARRGRVYGWGWVFHRECRVSSVVLTARANGDTEGRIECAYGLQRPDVGATHPDVSWATTSGFLASGELPKGRILELFLEICFPSRDPLRIDLRPLVTYGNTDQLKVLKVVRRLTSSAIRHLLRGDIKGLLHKTREKLILLGGAARTAKNETHALIDAIRHAPSRPLLIIDHNMGGGANFYRDRLINQRRATGQSIVLIYYDLQTLDYRIHYLEQEHDRTFRVESFDVLSDVARVVGFNEIFVNNAVSWDEPLLVAKYLLQLRDFCQAKLTVVIHDYFPICPSWTLLDDQGRFCKVPGIERCRECLSNHRGLFSTLVQNRNIDEWREAWGSCLHAADSVLCFSQSSVDLLRRAYPSLDPTRVLVTPHTVDYLPPRKPRIIRDAALHIGVVGEITEHKGSGIVKRMAESIAEQRLPVQITVIGTIDIPCDPSIVHVTGPYRREDLATIIEHQGVNLCFLPSIWPETFSYVTEELIRLGVPIAVFDIGAPPERVREYRYGLVLKEIDAKYALDRLVAFHAGLSQETHVPHVC